MESTATSQATYCARRYRTSMVAIHKCTGGTYCKGNCKPAVKIKRAVTDEAEIAAIRKDGK